MLEGPMRRIGRVLVVAAATGVLLAGPSLFDAAAATCVPADDPNNGGHVCVVRTDYGPYGNALGVTAGTSSSGVRAAVGCENVFHGVTYRGLYVSAGSIGGGYSHLNTAILGPEASGALFDAGCPVLDAVGDAIAGAG